VERLHAAKAFAALTSARGAIRKQLPHFRLHKVWGIGLVSPMHCSRIFAAAEYSRLACASGHSAGMCMSGDGVTKGIV
jgi:hypothetical protein